MTIEDDEIADLLAAAFNCRAEMERGHYCECVSPELPGGLMCRACGLRNKDAERAVVKSMVSAHPFTPDERIPVMCDVCSNWEHVGRHRGIPSEGVTSWGERVQGQDQRGEVGR